MTYNGTAESLLRQVRERTDEECLALPRSKRLAAVADDDAGPTVLPVKYVVDRGGVLFSTAAGRSGAGVGQRCGARRGHVAMARPQDSRGLGAPVASSVSDLTSARAGTRG